MFEQYLAMSTEFNFIVLDANQLIEAQQATVRELVTQRLDLESFRHADRPAPKPARKLPRKVKELEEEIVE